VRKFKRIPHILNHNDTFDCCLRVSGPRSRFLSCSSPPYLRVIEKIMKNVTSYDDVRMPSQLLSAALIALARNDPFGSSLRKRNEQT